MFFDTELSLSTIDKWVIKNTGVVLIVDPMILKQNIDLGEVTSIIKNM